MKDLIKRLDEMTLKTLRLSVKHEIKHFWSHIPEDRVTKQKMLGWLQAEVDLLEALEGNEIKSDIIGRMSSDHIRRFREVLTERKYALRADLEAYEKDPAYRDAVLKLEKMFVVKI